jgi:putative zinc finger/helix-turn-helix YgiT family protein
MVQKTGPVEAEYRTHTFTVSIPALVCPKCGFYSVDGGDDLTEMMRLLADEYRKKYGLLTSVEIKAFRDSRGESQKEFARYLRVGEASVKRWELGAIQDEAMDELIRLKCDPEKARANAEQLQRKARSEVMESKWTDVSPAQHAASFDTETGNLQLPANVTASSGQQYAYGA